MGEKDKKTREKIITIFEIFYIKLHCKKLYVREMVWLGCMRYVVFRVKFCF